MKHHTPKGTFDLLPFVPKELFWQNGYLFSWLEDLIRKTASLYHYRELRTPLFETTDLFLRSVGQESDIVQKEMYTFLDRSDRSLTLRPEGTSPFVRSYIEHQFINHPEARKIFYIGPYFRYERPQKGRYRMFHQAGFEISQAQTIYDELELFLLIKKVLDELQISSFEIAIQTLGEQEEKSAFSKALVSYLKPFSQELSQDSQLRLEKNPLRILDSKDPHDRALLENAPQLMDFLSERSRADFENLLSLLTAYQIPYRIDPLLVRGLDYYNRTVFEIRSNEGGTAAGIALGGGGRYDQLVQSMGGPPTAMFGCAFGLERLFLSLNRDLLPKEKVDLVLIPLCYPEEAVQLAQEARKQGLVVDCLFGQTKAQKAAEKAARLFPSYWIFLGEEEHQEKRYRLKELSSGLEFETFDPIQEILKRKQL